MLGACGIWGITFFGGAFLIKVLGLPKPVDIIGPWPTLFLFFVPPLALGGFIGDKIGKRRNYRLPLTP